MSVMITMCFISVLGGFVNVPQITQVKELDNKVYIVTVNGFDVETGDKTAKDFLKRIEKACEAKQGN